MRGFEAVHPQPDLRPSLQGVFAAIDLGTNNCRLLMGTPSAEGFRVVDSYSRTVRLGEGVDRGAMLGEAAMERALVALRAIAARLHRRQVSGLRAVATEACRQARNGPAFLRQVQAETGLKIDIISAREEAELALESCASLLLGGGRRALVFDIGGGSTELAWVRLDGKAQGQAEGQPTPELIGYASLPLGVVSLFERHGPDVFSAPAFEAMVTDVLEGLRRFEDIHRIRQEVRAGGVWMLGTSGTVTTLAGVAMGLLRYRRLLVDGTVLTAEAAGKALAVLRGLGPVGLAAQPCIGPDRTDFVLPGCAVFEAIRRVWPVGDVIVADRGLREGMLLRLMRQAAGRGTPADAPRRVFAPTAQAV